MLEHFFGSKTRVKLLQLFFASPERPFFLRELSRLAETQLNAVRREIARLELVGLIRQVERDIALATGAGFERAKFYALNTNFFLFGELKALLGKAQLLQEQAFIDSLKKRGGDIKLLLLTGTFSGEEKADTDIVLVGALKYAAVSKLIRDLEKSLGKSLRYTFMEPKEFEERNEIGDVFLYKIFQGKHFVVIDEFHSSWTPRR